MTRTLSLRERRLVAVALATAVLGVLYLAIVVPIVSGFEDRAAERRFLLLRYERNDRLAASIPQLRRRAQAQRADALRFMIEAASAVQASEYLIERLHREIATAGGTVKGAEALEGKPRWVHVSAEAEMSLPQMTNLLQRLRSVPPYIFVESLHVVADRALASGNLEPMDVSIEVSIPYTLAADR